MSENTPYLNLDEISSPDVTIVHKEVSHVMQEMTVESFIKSLNEAKQLDAKDGDSEDYMEQTLKLITTSFPTFDEVELRKMSITKLGKIVSFIMDVNSPEKSEASQSGKKTRRNRRKS